jgi:hypothetical protein
MLPAKIKNKKTKEVVIWDFSKGMSPTSDYVNMEIEYAYDGNPYVKGYAPSVPQEAINTGRIEELEKYLMSTDWYAIRKADNGEEIPEEIRIARQEARDEISRLRGE